MLESTPLHPCPCCGHLVFGEPPGSYNICPVCFWEDDVVQLRYPDHVGGANALSLVEAQRCYIQFGAMERRFMTHGRPAAADEPLDDGWRPMGEADRRERFEPGAQDPWPEDPTALYWWRDT
ncbi:hypothetical protein GCM10022223_55840 [Kineosporia mesophila]|uniref:Cysteine-rich CPCC domain-containing protein n=1 Tax=Kineosporia mesophila TaxID=566012 RepID=A0ABP7AFC3_9ACTN